MNNGLLILSCSILYIALSVNVLAQECTIYSVDEWIVRCDQTIQQLEDVLSKTDKQQHMNYTIANLCFLYDVKLNYMFQQYLGLLITTEQKKEASSEQVQWIKKKEVITDKIYNSYNGGTGGPYTSGLKYIKLTKERIKVLGFKISALILHGTPECSVHIPSSL